MANRDPEAEKAIINEYQQRKQRLDDILRKGQEISAEIAEHDVVLKTLEPMDAGRKCFRLVGDVMVERTVGEVAPAVKNNRDAMVTAITTLEEQAKQQNEELAAFVKKHNIRIIREGEEGQPAPPRQADEEEEEGETAKSKAPAGVLV